jgi:hypothetical protein
MEKVGIFYGGLEYITVIWYILWPFGNLCSDNLVYFPQFWYIVQIKLWQPWYKRVSPGRKGNVIIFITFISAALELNVSNTYFPLQFANFSKFADILWKDFAEIFWHHLSQFA